MSNPEWAGFSELDQAYLHLLERIAEALEWLAWSNDDTG
jgi:hypothetical protein